VTEQLFIKFKNNVTMKPGSILLGAAIGVVAGGLAGLLFAPKKGSVTRRFIAKKGTDYMGGMKERYSESLRNVNQKIDNLKDEVRNMMRKGQKEYKGSW
jgi:gas vesicle protein